MPNSRRRRTTTYSPPVATRPRQPPILATAEVSGREPSFAVRLVRTPRDVLPRILNGSLAQLLVRQPFEPLPARPRPVSRQITRPIQPSRPVINKLAAKSLKTLREVNLPYVGHSNLCTQRADRRSAMFAKQVAGKKWGAGGPSMKHAKRTPESSYRCTNGR